MSASKVELVRSVEEHQVIKFERNRKGKQRYRCKHGTDEKEHIISKRYTQRTERTHLTLRTYIKPLTRCTICFAKLASVDDIVIGLFNNYHSFNNPV
jgi:insertion element IS1 protein InsB